MVKRAEFPEEGELVVGTVKEVKGFGAFVTLDEYPGKEGFIHIAEVASGWVKYVRDYVRENQKVVCKVMGVDKSKGHVDLSLRRVNDHQRRETISEWKNEQKAEKLLEIFGEREDKSFDDIMEEFGADLVEAYGNLYTAFEAAAIDEDALVEDGFEGDWIEGFTELARENISIPYVTIKGFVDLQSFAPNGVEDIREALKRAEDVEYEDIEVEVQYIGAPHYRIHVKAPDYKVAEEELRDAADRAMKFLQEKGGKAQFHRTTEDLKAKQG